jgi:hypothetical protein
LEPIFGLRTSFCAPRCVLQNSADTVLAQITHSPSACSESFDSGSPFSDCAPRCVDSAIFGLPAKIYVVSVRASKLRRCLCNIWIAHQNLCRVGACFETPPLPLQYLDCPPKFMSCRCVLRNTACSETLPLPLQYLEVPPKFISCRCFMSCRCVLRNSAVASAIFGLPTLKSTIGQSDRTKHT